MSGLPTNVSESTRRLNPHLYGVPSRSVALGAVSPPIQAVPAKRLRQDTKPLLNKLESQWLACMESDEKLCYLRAQSKRFRLGNGVWYKPDFTAQDVESGCEVCFEVKGPKSWRGGFENLKVAAGLYRENRWVLVWKDPATGAWQRQEVLP